jgi:hypothetical protein
MTEKELLQQIVNAWEHGSEIGIVNAIEAIRTRLEQPKKEWVGLTDDEIKKVNQLGIYEKPLIEFARDIEAKLKEKNFD